VLVALARQLCPEVRLLPESIHQGDQVPVHGRTNPDIKHDIYDQSAKRPTTS